MLTKNTRTLVIVYLSAIVLCCIIVPWQATHQASALRVAMRPFGLPQKPVMLIQVSTTLRLWILAA